jgi:hypothetical protein
MEPSDFYNAPAFHSKCGIDKGLIKEEAQQTSDDRGAGAGWGPPLIHTYMLIFNEYH